MTYIPVGTILTYTATIKLGLTQGLAAVLATFKTTLQAELPGAEEFDIETANGSPSIFGPTQINCAILNNGVDHGSETDCQSIFDGVLENQGVTVISSSITNIQLPNNPGDVVISTQTGAPSNLNVAGTPSVVAGSQSSFSLPSLSGGSIAGISTTVIILGIVALILLLPTGFGRALRAVR